MITSLDFVAVPTRDPDRARSFYVDTLGLRPDEGAQYEFWVGETCFALWQPERLGQPFVAQNNGHLALHVDEVKASRKGLEAKGITFLGDTFDTGVCYMAFFKDPDGNDLMLHSRYAADLATVRARRSLKEGSRVSADRSRQAPPRRA